VVPEVYFEVYSVANASRIIGKPSNLIKKSFCITGDAQQLQVQNGEH
jgi:hypothetical protein